MGEEGPESAQRNKAHRRQINRECDGRVCPAKPRVSGALSVFVLTCSNSRVELCFHASCFDGCRCGCSHRCLPSRACDVARRIAGCCSGCGVSGCGRGHGGAVRAAWGLGHRRLKRSLSPAQARMERGGRRHDQHTALTPRRMPRLPCATHSNNTGTAHTGAAKRGGRRGQHALRQCHTRRKPTRERTAGCASDPRCSRGNYAAAATSRASSLIPITQHLIKHCLQNGSGWSF